MLLQLISPKSVTQESVLSYQARPYWPWLLSCLPVALYFFSFFYFGINAPQFDDFQTVVRSVALFDKADSLLQWLISNYGEHRIAYVRLVAVAVHRLTGSINFVWMALIGNLSLVGVIIILGAWFKRWKLERYFLPVPFILFQMHYHHNTFTAMMALQNLTILLWALLTFWWVADGRGWRLGGALFIAIVAMYTSGNGMFVLATALLTLVIRRQWTYALGGLVIGSIALVGYFWNLHSVTPNYSPYFLVTHFPQFVAFIIFFCGSYFDLLPNVLMRSATGDASWYQFAAFGLRLVLPFIVGLLLLLGGGLFVLRWCLNDWFINNPPQIRWLLRFITRTARPFIYHREASLFLAAGITFILLSASIVAIGRLEVSLAQSFAIRYKVYAPLLLILVYGVLLISARREATRKRLHRVLLVVGVLICVNSYVQHINQIQANRNTALSGLYSMQVSGTWPVYGSFYGNIDSVMHLAVDKGMYQLSGHGTEPVSTLRNDLHKPCPTVSVSFDTTNLTARLELKHPPLMVLLPSTEPNDGAYFILHNEQQTYVFSAHPNRNLLGIYQPGYWCTIERSSLTLRPGLYKITLMTRCHGQRRLYSTVNQLKLAGQRPG